MALVDTGVETSVIYGDSIKFNRDRMMMDGFWGQIIPVASTWLKLGVGCLPPREYKVSIAPVQHNILGTGILWGLALQQLWESSDINKGALVSGWYRQY